MKKNILFAVILLTIVVTARLIPHPPNFTPLAAVALFGGTYLNRKTAVILPLAALFLSDLTLGFHSTMLYVYSAMVLTSIIGIWISKKNSIKKTTAATIISSILFYLITNFGVWAQGTLYPKTLTGLIDCYYMALPFFRNSLAGNIVYVSLLFGGYELVLAKSDQLKKALSN